MVDAAIGLQNPKFDFSMIMASKGHNKTTLQKILESTEEDQFPNLLGQFMIDANISVGGNIDAANIVRRKRREIEEAGNATELIMKAVSNITETLEKSEEYQELKINLTSMSEEELTNFTVYLRNSENIQDIGNLTEFDKNNRFFDLGDLLGGLVDSLVSPLLNGLLDSLIVPFIDTLGTNIVPTLAEPLLNAAGRLLKILLQQIMDNLDPLKPQIKGILKPLGDVTNEVFNESFDILMPTGYMTTPDAADWALGKKEQTYGWNPEESPNMCKKAQSVFEGGLNDYWNDQTETPGKKCNEFIFSQM